MQGGQRQEDVDQEEAEESRVRHSLPGSGRGPDMAGESMMMSYLHC